MSSYKAKALILKGYSLGDYDKILKMYSQHQGVLSGVARGARKPKSRFGARIGLFNLVDLEMARGRSLDIITQAEIIESFKNISSDFNKFVFCGLIAKIVLKTQTEASGPCEDLFKLIYICLREIDACHNEDIPGLKKIVCFFMARFLSVTGYAPLFDSCSRCNANLQKAPAGDRRIPVSVRLGGILCPDCASGREANTRLAPESFKFFKGLFNLKIEQVRDREVDKHALNKVYRFLENYIIYHTDCSLDSFRYLKKIGL
ncbi:MAG: DNA repair protein RecO [Actinomycetota bacterium]